MLSKLLVANVILNRVEDSHFPDTISEVVWEKVDGYAQFSPTEDGRIYSCTITESTIEAVDRACREKIIPREPCFLWRENPLPNRMCSGLTVHWCGCLSTAATNITLFGNTASKKQQKNQDGSLPGFALANSRFYAIMGQMADRKKNVCPSGIQK